MMNIVITVPDSKDSTVIIKLNNVDFRDPKSTNPVGIITELKDLIEGRENIN